jgi:hypothetical protein
MPDPPSVGIRAAQPLRTRSLPSWLAASGLLQSGRLGESVLADSQRLKGLGEKDLAGSDGAVHPLRSLASPLSVVVRDLYVSRPLVHTKQIRYWSLIATSGRQQAKPRRATKPVDRTSKAVRQNARSSALQICWIGLNGSRCGDSGRPRATAPVLASRPSREGPPGVCPRPTVQPPSC